MNWNGPNKKSKHSNHIGIFGGTFDPPHIGHLILAAEAYAQLSLERLLWVLTPDPPHKQGQHITNIDTRLTLLQAALEDNPAFEISTVDIERPGPHFALDTVKILRRNFPSKKLVYLMGGDSLRDLPSWYCHHDLINEIAVLGVMRRPGDEIDLESLEMNLPGLHNKVHFIEAPLLTIAASDIRQRIIEGRPYRYYLQPSVYKIIKQCRLYTTLLQETQKT